MEKTIERVRSYKLLKAEIVKIDLEIEELEDEVIGIKGVHLTEKTSRTYKISSTVEQQVERLDDEKERLLMNRKAVEREIFRIDNALSVLTEEEKEVMVMSQIERRKYWKIEELLNLSYSRIKGIEKQAISKMDKYLQ